MNGSALALTVMVISMIWSSGAWAGTVRSNFPVPSITLYPGDKITEDILIQRRFRLRRRSAATLVREKRKLIGMIARRTLRAGKPIARNAVMVDDLIKEGTRVAIEFQSGALLITGTAVAMQSGSIGDTISLRNEDSGVTVRGIVRKNGVVSVGER